MRQRKLDLRARVNGDLQLEFDDVALTSYAGLELFARYLRRTRFNPMVREAFAGTTRWGDYGVVAMVRLLVGLLIIGGRRLRHLAYVQDDPLFRRFAGVHRVPTARTVSRWLKQFTMTTVDRLQLLNAGIVARVLPRLTLRTLTIDVDGVVVSTGHQVERAFRGFNPHHRRVPSYYPILAHVAETTHILRVKNRSGNVHDGKASLPFLRELWDQVTATVTAPRLVRFRMDGAFFREDVLRWLQARGVGYAIKVPFYHWLDLQQYIRAQREWAPVAPGVTGFAMAEALTHWGFPVAVTIYRKQVRHPDGEELPARPVRPERRVLRVLGGGESAGAHGPEPLALHGGTRQPREDDRAAQKRPGVSHRPDQRVRGQQRVAATRRACPQSLDELSNRHRRRTTNAVAETHGAAFA